MAQKVSDIVDLMNQLAPPEKAMNWDAVGLQVGSMESIVDTVFVTLDLTPKSLAEGKRHQSQMIITHHPFLFHPLKHVITDEWNGSIIQDLLKSDISLFSAHTNMDITWGGLNDWVARKIGLNEITVLDETGMESAYKIVVFIPETYEESLAKALGDIGAGHIGKYSHCSFRITGTGAFKPLKGSNPSIGRHGKMEYVKEVRFETIVPENLVDKAIRTMEDTHPYEEVAYDLIRIDNSGSRYGIGRKGCISKAQTPQQMVNRLKKIFGIKKLQWVPGVHSYISQIAILTGSGASAIKAAADAGCHALITGDVKYHDAQEAESAGIHIFDVSHFDSEKCFIHITTQYLTQAFRERNWEIRVISDEISENPIRIV